VIYAIFIDFVCSITNVCLNKTVVQIPVDDLRKGTPLLLTCLHTSRYIHNSPIYLYLIFYLQKSISKLIFVDYTGSKNQVWNRPSNLIFTTWLFKNQVQMDRANRKVSKPQWGQILHEIALDFFYTRITSLCDNYVLQWWVGLVVY